MTNPQTWVYAMGQAFFSLSVAGSGTVVYGSYLRSDVDIVSSAKYVAFFDTLAALLAGLVIIPAVFAYGMEPNSGPGLLFITIPAVIRSIPFGQVFAILFFLAVLFAGATSLVNLLESPVEALQSRFGWSRRSALILVGAVTAAAGLFVEGSLLSPWMDTPSPSMSSRWARCSQASPCSGSAERPSRATPFSWGADAPWGGGSSP